MAPYDDQFVLPLGKVSLTFHHTPGHSPGSMVIVLADGTGTQRSVITGDTLFPGSCGRIDLDDSDKVGERYRTHFVLSLATNV